MPAIRDASWRVVLTYNEPCATILSVVVDNRPKEVRHMEERARVHEAGAFSLATHLGSPGGYSEVAGNGGEPGAASGYAAGSEAKLHPGLLAQAVARIPRQAGRRARLLVSSIATTISERSVPGRPGSTSVAGFDGSRAPVSLHVAGGVAVISLRRPAKMNAISAEMWSDIARLVREASRAEGVRVLVFRGEGGHFSAGSDLKEMAGASLGEVEDIFHLAEECVAAIEESPLPTVAVIPGYALGTGLLLALACDLRVVSEEAKLGMPMARLGITLSEPFVKRLVALIGPSRTKDFVYTGRIISGEEAHSWGLAERLVTDGGSAMGEAFRVARAARLQSSTSLQAVKRWAGSGSGRVPAAYNYVDPVEFPEGVSAFLDKRTPDFAWGADDRCRTPRNSKDEAAEIARRARYSGEEREQPSEESDEGEPRIGAEGPGARLVRVFDGRRRKR